jgi:small subunit ribosomal protein S21
MQTAIATTSNRHRGISYENYAPYGDFAPGNHRASNCGQLEEIRRPCTLLAPASTSPTARSGAVVVSQKQVLVLRRSIESRREFWRVRSSAALGGDLAPKKGMRAFMIKVKSRGNETAEQMLRRFKKMCEKEGLTKDIKRVAYYEKPSEKRRRRNRKGGGPRMMR